MRPGSYWVFLAIALLAIGTITFFVRRKQRRDRARYRGRSDYLN